MVWKQPKVSLKFWMRLPVFILWIILSAAYIGNKLNEEEFMRLLVAEDNERLLKTLTRILVKEGYTVDGVSDGDAALDYIKATKYDGMVLDIMMSGSDGLDVLRQARTLGVTAPAMFLTALSDIPKRVEGLDAGADDYLTKPFDTSEFIARVHAMLRRRDSYMPKVISFADTELDCANHQITCNGNTAHLSHKEYQILEIMLRQPGAAVSKETIIEYAWSWDKKADTNVIWVQMTNLRRKIEEIGSHWVIRYARGAGYLIEDGREAD